MIAAGLRAGVFMTEQYIVASIRKSGAASTGEGIYTTQILALSRLAELGADSDCLLAEVYWSDASGFGEIIVIAQSERIDGRWTPVPGELHSRTRVIESQEVFRATCS